MALTTSFLAGQNSSSQTPKNGQQITQETIDQLPVSGRHCFEVSKESLQPLTKLNPSLPIQRQMASVMAQAYFEHIYGLCGALKPPVESSSAWSFPCVVGVGAWPAYPIVIDKATGRISCGSYESFKSLSAFRAHLTLRSSRTPPALPSALSQHFAIPAPLIASAQAWPLSFFR